MTDDILRIKTITQLQDIIGFDKPKHPLISLTNANDLKDGQEIDVAALIKERKKELGLK